MSKRVTLAEVAALAGYSVPTVSMVLTGRKGTRISEKAALKIHAAADELGYSPDPAARSLRTGKTEAIGFVSDQVTVTRFASALITGAAERSQEENHVVIIAESGRTEEGRKRAVKALTERRVDGLIVALVQARLVEIPEAHGSIPAVIVNGACRGLTSVLPDEYTAGFRAASYLVERGHRRIALIGKHAVHADPEWSVTLTARFKGIADALAGAGVSLAAVHGLKVWSPHTGEDAAMQVLSETEGLTAVICGNDMIAFGVYRAARRLGLGIPEDLSVISFDDEQLADYLKPGLTTMRLPYEEMGRVAADLVLTASASGEDILIDMPLVERESVANLEEA